MKKVKRVVKSQLNFEIKRILDALNYPSARFQPIEPPKKKGEKKWLETQNTNG